MASLPRRFAFATAAFVTIAISSTMAVGVATNDGCVFGEGTAYYRSDPAPPAYPFADPLFIGIPRATPGALAMPPGPPPVALGLCVAAAPGKQASCALGVSRTLVTPARVACERQSVPARTRRKVRVWERDASV